MLYEEQERETETERARGRERKWREFSHPDTPKNSSYISWLEDRGRMDHIVSVIKLPSLQDGQFSRGKHESEKKRGGGFLSMKCASTELTPVVSDVLDVWEKREKRQCFGKRPLLSVR